MKLVIMSPLETIDVKAKTLFNNSFLTILERIIPTEPTVNAAKLFMFSLLASYIFKL